MSQPLNSYPVGIQLTEHLHFSQKLYEMHDLHVNTQLCPSCIMHYLFITGLVKHKRNRNLFRLGTLFKSIIYKSVTLEQLVAAEQCVLFNMKNHNTQLLFLYIDYCPRLKC